MPDIKVTTSADLKGFRDLQSEMNKMIQQAERYASLMRSVGQIAAGHAQMAATGGGGSAQAPGAHPPMPGGAPVGRGSSRRVSPGGHSYNMNTASGVEQYYANVLMPAMSAMNMGKARGGMMNMGGVRYQPRGSSVNPVTDAQISQWFGGLMNRVNQMDQEVQKVYLNAAMESSKSPSVIRDFYQQFGGQLGGPQPTVTPNSSSFGKRFMQHFLNNTGSGSLGGMIMGGIKGGLGGSVIDAVMGGGEAGGAAGALGGGLLGGKLGGPVGAAVGVAVQQLVGWIGGQIKQGMQTYSDTAGAFSQFYHALNGATSSAEGFREATLRAGAVVGMNASQSTQTAATLMAAYGSSLGAAGLTNLTKQTGAFALQSGIDPAMAASIDALGAQLGLTSGAGRSMSPLQFNEMLANVTLKGKMSGRQASLYTGLMSVYSQLGSVNPIITSGNATAAQFAAMNASGVQGLQAQAGANILSTMNSTIGSGQGLGGLMSMAAIYQASAGKITNPWQMRSIAEQGLGAKVGSTTLGSQLVGMVKSMAPGDIYTQAGLLSSMTGISENQAIEMLRSGALSATSISTTNNQYQRNTLYDQNNIAKNVLAAQASKLGYTAASIKAIGAKIGGVPTGSTLAGPSGNLYTPPGATKGDFSSNTSNRMETQFGYVPTSMNQAQQAFINRMLPIAKQVSAKTGFSVSDLLGEWGLESSWGTSQAALANNNFAGINPFGKYKAGRDSAYAGFSSLQQFAQADIQVLNQKNYAGARALARKGASTADIFSLLTREGYDTTDPGTYGASVAGAAKVVVTLSPESAQAVGQAVATSIFQMHMGIGSR